MQEIYTENIPKEEEIQVFLENLNDLSIHNKIINNAIEFSTKIPNVEAIYIMGSLALDTADIFSDIDFYVMINQTSEIDEIKSLYLSNLFNFGKVIHVFQSNAYSKNSIIYFKPYIKFDLMIDHYEKMINNWRLGKRAKLVFDRNGLGRKAMIEANEISFDLKKYELEIRNLAIELPSFCYNIAGYMLRGEYITSIDFVAWIRRLLMRISGFLIGIWDEGTRRAEARFPEEIISFYYQIKISKINDVWSCLNVFLKWYSQWLIPLFEKFNIPHAGEEVPLMKGILSKLKMSFDT